MISRRILLGCLGMPLAVGRAYGQTRNAPPIVGFVGFASPRGDQATLSAFQDGMAALGHRIGGTVRLDARSVDGNIPKGIEAIRNLSQRPVDVFLSPGPAVTRAIVRQTTIPVVAIGLPTEAGAEGLFQSLAKPGGSVTGFSNYSEELSLKRIEALREIGPTFNTVGVLHNSLDPAFSSWGDRTVGDLEREGLRAVRLPLSSTSPAEAARLIDELRNVGGQAVIVIRDFVTSTLVDDVCQIAARAKIVVVGEQRAYAEAGALFTYGPDLPNLFFRAADYVDRILRGEAAGNLPIQMPARFSFILNRSVAHAMGIALPATALLRADEIID